MKGKDLKRINLYYRTDFYEPHATVQVEWKEPGDEPTITRLIEEEKEFKTLKEALDYINDIRDLWEVK